MFSFPPHLLSYLGKENEQNIAFLTTGVIA